MRFIPVDHSRIETTYIECVGKMVDGSQKVTKDDVVRVAKKYVHTDDLTLLVVGKASDFPKSLDTLGKVTTLDITIPKKPATN